MTSLWARPVSKDLPILEVSFERLKQGFFFTEDPAHSCFWNGSFEGRQMAKPCSGTVSTTARTDGIFSLQFAMR